MRVKPAEFQNLNLRCHALLSDVPLHDVWAIPLTAGGPGRSARASFEGDGADLRIQLYGQTGRRQAP
jgi:hypothetical protein